MNEAVSGTRIPLGPTVAEIVFYWFHRLVAVYCLLFGVAYWIRLIGFYEGPLNRFDLMPSHWQVAAVSLAALFPFAASGLWMVASWGPVIWFLCAVAETTMYAGFPDLFGENWPVVASHAGVAVLYLLFRGVIYFQKRSRQQR